MNTFFKDLTDFDTYMPRANGKWPSLKIVFDNLRCYPILALYGIALQFLSKSKGQLEIAAFWFLAPLFLLILLACLFQTALLLSVLTIGILSVYFQPNGKAAEVLRGREVLVRRAAIVVFWILLVVSFVAATKLLYAFSRLSPGA